MEKSSCGGRLSESICEKCFPQIHQIADLQRRGEQFHFYKAIGCKMLAVLEY